MRHMIRFAVGLSVVAVSAIGSSVAHSPVEVKQVIGQEVLTDPHSFSETDFQLSDRQQLKGYFLAELR